MPANSDDSSPLTPQPPLPQAGEGEVKAEHYLRLPSDLALHARPAGAVTKAAMRFQARVTISANGKQADARSVLSVMGLGARGGTTLRIVAEGTDAEAAIAAVVACLGGEQEPV
jgi:phosphotransferase system HPr (HPr) family protein